MTDDILHPSDRSPYAAVQHFDLRGEPVQLTRREWNPHRRRDPAALRGIVLHSWDTPVGTMPVDRARHGEPLALARRGLSVPYTISCGVTQHSGEPVVVLAHPPERYTHASDAACGEWLAIGVMGRFAFDAHDAEANGSRTFTADCPALALAVGAAIDLAARLLGGPDERYEDAPLRLITHRQAINGRGDHRECPGEAVVTMALRSDAARRGIVVPDPDLVLVPEWGRSWPDCWRAHLPTFAAPAVPPAALPKRIAVNVPTPPQVDLLGGKDSIGG